MPLAAGSLRARRSLCRVITLVPPVTLRPQVSADTLGDNAMIEQLKIRSANPTDADELLAIRRDAIMALAEEYGRIAAERWASGAPPDRTAKAIETNSVWVTECASMVVGWVEISGVTIEGLYVTSAAARRGVGSSLLAHAERQIRATGASVAYLDASPNAEPFYARRGYKRVGAVKANNSIPMSKRLDVSAA